MKKILLLSTLVFVGWVYFLIRDYNTIYVPVSDGINDNVINLSEETKLKTLIDNKQKFEDFIKEYKESHKGQYEKSLCSDSKVNVAVILIQKEFSQQYLRELIDNTPSHVTLAFQTQAMNEDVLRLARDKHHEVILTIPMEPVNFPDNNPGPLTLLTGLTLDENMKNLEKLLSFSKYSIGFLNIDGGRFAVSKNDLLPILEKLSSQNFFFVNAVSFDGNITDEIIKESSCITENYKTLLPYDYMSEDRLKDFFNNVDASIKSSEEQSHLVIIYASHLSLEALKTWIKAHNQEYNFITLSNYLFNKERLKYEKGLQKSEQNPKDSTDPVSTNQQ